MSSIKNKLENIQSRLKYFFASSGILVILVILAGILGSLYFIPHKADSVGDDPGTIVDDKTVADIAKAAKDGVDSYKAIIGDHTTSGQIAEMLKAAKDNGISIVTRPYKIDVNTYTSLLNSGISTAANSYGFKPDRKNLFISCCSNEPEVDEPKLASIEAQDMKYFLDNFNFKQAAVGSYVINANGTFWIEYYVKYMEELGKLNPDALEQIDFTPINNYGNMGAQLSAVVDVMNLFFLDPKVFIFETSPMFPDRRPMTFEQFRSELLSCQTSSHCIGSMLFNPYFQNGQFVTNNWHSFTQDQIKTLMLQAILKKVGSNYNSQQVQTLAYNYLKWLQTKDPKYATDAAKFEELILKVIASVQKQYSQLGNENLYGVSSKIELIDSSCRGGKLDYSVHVIRNDPMTGVNDVSLGIAYNLIDSSGKISLGSFDVGSDGKPMNGSPRYGGNFNNPGGENAPTGNIINLTPGMNDNIDHTIEFGSNFTGVLEVMTDVGFNSQYGFNHMANVCRMIITKGQCSQFECSGGATNDIFCKANNDQIPPPPKKPKEDAPAVNSCEIDNSNRLQLEHTERGLAEGTIKTYRLGFQITGIQLLKELSEEGKDTMLEPISSPADYEEDNTPEKITKHLAIKEINTSSNDGYIRTDLANFILKLNGDSYDSGRVSRDLHGSTSVDTGVDLLEYVFEKVCYFTTTQSTKTLCDTLFDNLNKASLLSYDDLNTYKYYGGLKSKLLSCDQGTSGFNLDAYKEVGGLETPVNPDGTGSYIVYEWDMEPHDVIPKPLGSGKGRIDIEVSAEAELYVSRINWMLSNLLATENTFVSKVFESQKQFDDYYNKCLVGPISGTTGTGGAAKITYMMVLEEAQELQCPVGKIQVDKYEWKRIKTASGESYIPGLGSLYTFLSHVSKSAQKSGQILPDNAPGVSFRFNPNAPDPCFNLVFVPQVQANP